MRPLRLAVLAAAAAVSACGESTGARSSLALAITVTGIDGPHLTDAPDGTATIECGIGLRASPTGSGSASWVGATIRYYVGVSGDPPVDSVRIALGELESAWGGPTIHANSDRDSHWTFRAPFPFSASIAHEFRPDDTKQVVTATTEFHCGPVVTSGTPAPVVRTIQAVPVGGGVVQPGGALDVSFEAHSPVGIWQSLVVVDGACELQQLFAERLQQTVTRQVRLTIPSTCEIGGSVVVSAFVLDAGAREQSRTVANALPVADLTPPTMAPVLVSPITPGMTTPLEGTYFPGDTLRVQFGAADNHRLAWLGWEIAEFGVRDSVAVPVSGSEPLVEIPVEDGWVGPFVLRLWARDSSGLEASQTSAPDAMRSVPTLGAPMLADTVQWDLTDVIVDAPRERIYVLQGLSRRVAAFSLTTLELVGTAGFSAAPHDMDLTLDGTALVVAVGGSQTLAIVDLQQPALPVVEIPLALDPNLSQYPTGVAALADGRVLVLLGSFQGLIGNRMHEIDLTTQAQRGRPDVSADGIVGGSTMQRSGNGRRVLISSGNGARIYDLATDTFSDIVAPRSFAYVSVDSTGDRVAMGLDALDEHLSLIATMEGLAGHEMTSSELAPSGAFLAHAWRDRGILWSSVSDGLIQYRLTIPYTVSRMRFTPDGRVLIAAGSFPGSQQSVLMRYELP